MSKALTDRARELKALYDAMKDAEIRLKDAARRYRIAEEELSIEMGMAGVPTLPIRGVATFVARVDFHLNQRGDLPPGAAVDALKKGGLDDYIGLTYNSGGLKSHLKERLKELRESNPAADAEQVVPEVLRPYFQAYEKPRITVRAAPKN